MIYAVLTDLQKLVQESKLLLNTHIMVFFRDLKLQTVRAGKSSRPKVVQDAKIALSNFLQQRST